MLRLLTSVLSAAVFCLPLWAAGPRYTEWSSPQQIAGAVDVEDADDAPGCVTRDGRTMFFFSNRKDGAYGGFDIWVTHWDDETLAWGAPTNLGPNVNSSKGDFTPALSRDAHWLFFASNRPGSIGVRDLYAAYRKHTHDDTGWEPAFNLGPVVNSTSDEFGVTYFSGDEGVPPQLFFSSTRSGNFDLYVTEMNPDGTFGPPALLGEVSTPLVEMLPAIRHDGREMLFASDRPGGLGGQDIWVTTRESVFDAWSEPVNVGSGVDSEMDELYPILTPDNTVLLFYRGLLGKPFLPSTIWGSTRAKMHP